MMRDSVLVTHDLTKQYGNAFAVDHVNLHLEAGGIYGLIGRNGAGKTSLMRLISGLSVLTGGSIELFGDSAGRELGRARSRLGILIEEPGLNRGLTAMENMDLHRRIRGVSSKDSSRELLALVGLSSVGRKRVRDFSLGMRQRLGIAIALLANPDLLILDEPVNGLDPSGVVEVRNLIKQLQESRGLTILISSHNLPELFQTATNYIIMDRGKVKQELTLAELEARMEKRLHIDCSDPQRLPGALEGMGMRGYEVMPDKSIRVNSGVDDLERIMRDLVAQSIYPTAFFMEGDTLESYFLAAVEES